jgi:peroxiredoxin
VTYFSAASSALSASSGSSGRAPFSASSAVGSRPLRGESPSPRRRRPLLRALVVALALGTAACATSSGGGGPAVGSAEQAPDFQVDLLEGGKFRLSEHYGKDVVIIDFWTTFCQPCIGALRELEAIYEKRKGDGLVVLGVSMDPPDTASAVGPFVRSHKLSFPVAHDVQSRIIDLYNKKSAMPYSVIIGRDGRILKIRESFQPGDEAAMEKDIDLALSAK